MALEIAFLGYNEEQTRQFFKQFAEDNRDQVHGCNFTQGYMQLKDGTKIRRVSADPAWIRGRRFDQVIVADDLRYHTFFNRWDELEELERRCAGSVIPEEFCVQFYIIDEEAPA